MRPRAVTEIRANADGTELEIISFTLDLGAQLFPKVNLSAPNGVDGFDMVGYQPTGSIK